MPRTDPFSDPIGFLLDAEQHVCSINNNKASRGAEHILWVASRMVEHDHDSVHASLLRDEMAQVIRSF